MNRYLTMAMIVVVASFYAASAYAAAGETWEVTTRTAGTGGPVLVPEMVMTVCLPPGGTKDPQRLLQQDNGCEVADIKTVGKKTTWKVRCGSGDDEMTGTGDVTYSSKSYQGVTNLTGRSGGEPVTMKVTYQGKRVGAVCDPSAQPVVKGMEGFDELMGMAKSQLAASMAEQCEVASYQAVDLISARFFGANAACPGKETFACKVISKAVAKDPVAYAKLAKYEDTSALGIAKTCKIDMSKAAKTICTKVNGDNYQELADYCPEEAKAYSVEYTKSAGQSTSTSPEQAPGSSILDNAIKLKGLFGF